MEKIIKYIYFYILFTLISSITVISSAIFCVFANSCYSFLIIIREKKKTQPKEQNATIVLQKEKREKLFTMR